MGLPFKSVLDYCFGEVQLVLLARLQLGTSASWSHTLGMGLTLTPITKVTLWGWQQILGTLPWSCCLSWFTSSLQAPDFAFSLQGASSLLCQLCSQLG